RECARVRLLAVVFVSADIPILAEGAPHVARGEKDRARALRTAIEQLLTRMMEMRADSRTGGELASAELGAGHAVGLAIPGTKIAVGEHAVGKFAAQLQQARSLRRLRQWRAHPDRLPTREKNWREAVEFDPQRVLAACRKIKQCGDGRGNAELGRAPVLRNVQIPRQRTANRWILPNCQLGQVAHGPAPWVYLSSDGTGVHLDAYPEAPVASTSGVRQQVRIVTLWRLKCLGSRHRLRV